VSLRMFSLLSLALAAGVPVEAPDVDLLPDEPPDAARCGAVTGDDRCPGYATWRPVLRLPLPAYGDSAGRVVDVALEAAACCDVHRTTFSAERLLSQPVGGTDLYGKIAADLRRQGVPRNAVPSRGMIRLQWRSIGVHA
jgi:hypothetical protein